MINAGKVHSFINEIKPWLNVEPFELKLEDAYQKHQIETSLYVTAALCLVAGIAFGSMLAVQLLQPGSSAHHNMYTTILRGSISLFLIYTALIIFFIPESTDRTGKRMFRMFIALTFVYPLVLLARPLNAPSTSELAVASILYCSSFTFRLNHRRYKIFFFCAIFGYYTSFFLFRGALAPSGLTAPIFDVAARMPLDYVPLLQLLQAAGLSYLIYRFSDARERRLFIGEQKIASSNNARLHLLQSVGHDLRQPMTSILLQQGIATEAAKQNNQPLIFESLAIIESSLQIMNAELNQLTEIAALQSEGFELKISPVELEPLVKSVISLFRAQARRNGIHINFETSLNTQRTWVASNHALLTSILINLISNAIKYSKPKSESDVPTVTVSVSALTSGSVEISVIDNGIGISEESLSKVWTPFFQINNPERSRSKGYGLGLSHVQVAISRLVGHNVSCISAMGQGSKFKVTVPVVSHRNSSDIQSSYEGSPFLFESESEKLVLIIDDESTVRKSLVTSFNKAGYLTADFATTREACEFIRTTNRTIHVAIVDYRLSDGTGADVFRYLIELHVFEPLGRPLMICLSGDSAVESNFKVEFPAVKFVRKPVSIERLFEIVFCSD